MTTIQAIATNVPSKRVLMGMRPRDVAVRFKKQDPITKEMEVHSSDLASLASAHTVELRDNGPQPAERPEEGRDNGKAQPSWFARVYTDMDGRVIVE